MYSVGSCPSDCQVVTNEVLEVRECQSLAFVVPCSWRLDCPSFCVEREGGDDGDACGSRADDIVYTGVTQLSFESADFADFTSDDWDAFSVGLKEMAREFGVVVTAPSPTVSEREFRTQIAAPPWLISVLQTLTVEDVVATSERLGRNFTVRPTSAAFATWSAPEPVYEAELMLLLSIPLEVTRAVAAELFRDALFRDTGVIVNTERVRLIREAEVGLSVIVLPIVSAQLPQEYPRLLNAITPGGAASTVGDLLSEDVEAARSFAQLALRDGACYGSIYPVYPANTGVYERRWTADTPSWVFAATYPLSDTHVASTARPSWLVDCPAGVTSVCDGAACGEGGVDQAVWPFVLVGVGAVLSVVGAFGVWYRERRHRRAAISDSVSVSSREGSGVQF
jgi:hypothetical protein